MEKKYLDAIGRLSLDYFIFTRSGPVLKPEVRKIVDQNINLEYNHKKAYHAGIRVQPSADVAGRGIKWIRRITGSIKGVTIFRYCSDIPDELPDYIRKV
jgi:hypothetical protein